MDAGDFETARSIVARMNYEVDKTFWLGENAGEFFAILEFLDKQAAEVKKEN